MALNSQIQVQQRQAGSDAAGQPLQAWVTVATLWAEIRHPTGLEAIRAGGQVSTVQASIKVRQRPGITAAMRVLHGTTVYDIRAVLTDQVDRAHMHLVCEVSS